jgi:L-fuculose-phosphate aldolase
MRSEIVRTARAMLERGLVTGTQGNVSARDGERILITPAGLPYEQMTPGDVVPIDDDRASSEWQVHFAIYAARADVAAIVHTHSPAATAMSFRDDAPFAVAAYAETGTAQLAVNAVGALGDGDHVLLAEHGVVGVGATLDDALAVCERVERLSVDP